MQTPVPSTITPESLVIAAMRDAVIGAGLAYHGPLLECAASRALTPDVVTWVCEGRLLQVGVRPEHHAKMTDDRRIDAWRWLLGLPKGT